MNILLTGATGFLGRHIRAALLQAGHTVVPVARSLGHDFAQLQTPKDWMPLLAGVDAVVNAVGIIGENPSPALRGAAHTRAPQALFAAAQAAGIARVVQISAQGADDSAFSAYHLSKRAADDAVRALPQPGWVLRPGLVFGPGGGSQALFMRLARMPRIPVLGDGMQAMQPVFVGDVVSTVLLCLHHEGPGQTLDLVAPRTHCLCRLAANTASPARLACHRFGAPPVGPGPPGGQGGGAVSAHGTGGQPAHAAPGAPCRRHTLVAVLGPNPRATPTRTFGGPSASLVMTGATLWTTSPSKPCTF